MFRRSKGSSRDNSREPSPHPPPPPARPDVWSGSTQSHYTVRSTWQWVMDEIATEGMTEVASYTELPTQLQLQQQQQNAEEMTQVTPATRRRRSAARKLKGPATLKIEVTDPGTENIGYAVHGTSSALDGMEDKDELVRTLQRCRCDHLNIAPPAVLIGWDVSRDECLNVLGKDLPTLKENKSEPKYAVLKEPMGSQGKGIYFVQTAEEIHKIIDEHRQRALNESEFLDNLIAVKGRIPSWVLQAEVAPALLIKNRRKFHIRTYVVILEKPHHPDILDIYIFNRHEVRVAGVAVPENDPARDPVSHITNGALSATTERVLLHEVDELKDRGIQEKVEVFVAEAFGKHLLPDMARRIKYSASQEDDSNGAIRKFAVAGLDIMITEGNSIYLLEVNANPAAPPEDIVDDTFREHLKGFMRSLVDLVVGNSSPDFLSAREILVRKGLTD